MRTRRWHGSGGAPRLRQRLPSPPALSPPPSTTPPPRTGLTASTAVTGDCFTGDCNSSGGSAAPPPQAPPLAASAPTKHLLPPVAEVAPSRRRTSGRTGQNGQVLKDSQRPFPLSAAATTPQWDDGGGGGHSSGAVAAAADAAPAAVAAEEARSQELGRDGRWPPRRASRPTLSPPAAPVAACAPVLPAGRRRTTGNLVGSGDGHRRRGGTGIGCTAGGGR